MVEEIRAYQTINFGDSVEIAKNKIEAFKHRQTIFDSDKDNELLTSFYLNLFEEDYRNMMKFKFFKNQLYQIIIESDDYFEDGFGLTKLIKHASRFVEIFDIENKPIKGGLSLNFTMETLKELEPGTNTVFKEWGDKDIKTIKIGLDKISVNNKIHYKIKIVEESGYYSNLYKEAQNKFNSEKTSKYAKWF
jgi:hypothetical protein